MSVNFKKKKANASVSGAGVIKQTRKGTVGSSVAPSNKKEAKAMVKAGKKNIKDGQNTAKKNNRKPMRGGSWSL
jgi:hypothetical protein